jgi:hypothetical protein
MRKQKTENTAKLLAITIGHEGRLNDAALDHVAVTVCQLAATFPYATQLVFLFRGYETETRRPEEVPEIARYVRKLALRIAGDVPTEKMAASTSLLVSLRSCRHSRTWRPGDDRERCRRRTLAGLRDGIVRHRVHALPARRFRALLRTWTF